MLVLLFEQTAQVSVFEMGVVFKTVAKEAVPANVTQPDQTNGQGERVVPTEENRQRWQEVTVTSVVEKRSNCGVANVANHEYVWNE